MAKINTEQLDLIRQYFLSFTGTQNPERTAATGKQIPEILQKELIGIFISEHYSKDVLDSYLRENQSEEFSDQLHALQQEFLFNQAELYISGGKNEMIDAMISQKNKIFLDEAAFQLTMREQIKLLELERSNKAFLAIHEQRLKAESAEKGITNHSKRPSPDSTSLNIPTGKMMKSGKTATSVAAGFRGLQKSSSQKHK